MIVRNIAIFFSIVCIFAVSFANSDIVEVETTLENHVFNPSTIDIPSGKKIRLIVKNNDDSVEEFESFDLKREKLIPSNSQVVIIIAPLDPGRYEFFGEFHEDTARGFLNVK